MVSTQLQLQLRLGLSQNAHQVGHRFRIRLFDRKGQSGASRWGELARVFARFRSRRRVKHGHGRHGLGSCDGCTGDDGAFLIPARKRTGVVLDGTERGFAYVGRTLGRVEEA